MISVYKDFDDVPVGLMEKGWKDALVRKRLTKIYHGKCAYSEVKLGRDTNSHIIHYRPQTQYPKLQDEWSNILPVSPECNHAYGNEFDILGEQIKVPRDKKQWRADSGILLGEKPKLLHPEIDTPENHLYIGSDGIMHPITARGQATIPTFNLNSESLLEKRRKKINFFRKKLSELYYQYEKVKDDIEDGYHEGRLIHEILFKQFFKELKQAGEPQAEFALLGRNMLEGFPIFFVNISFWDDDEKYKHLKGFIVILMEAENLFTSLPDIIKYKKSEKRVPIFVKENSVRMLKGLPYAIKAFEIWKYHGIKHSKIENIPINTRWVFLTGENGFGKTLVLQALALGLYGKKDKEIQLAEADCRVKIEMKHEKNNLITIAGSRAQKKFLNFAAYGPGRLSIDGNIFQGKQTPEKLRKTESLFQHTSSLYNIQEYLINIHGRIEYKNKFDAIVVALKKLLPWVERIRVDDSAEKKKILYRERTENGEVLDEIPFGALSAGSKSIIAMIGDMIIELLENQDVKTPSELKGIVIIDELDIHLHVKWQREFVTRLTETFPKIQFIASTHSPIPLLGAPLETVILNVDRQSKKEGIVVRKLDIDITNLTPNTILFSPVFDFQRIIPETYDRKTPLQAQENYVEVLFDKMLEDKLSILAKQGGMELADLLKSKGDD